MIILLSLSSGNQVSILSVSRNIPKYCNCTVGPAVLCRTIGTRSVLNTKVILATVISAVASGGYTVYNEATVHITNKGRYKVQPIMRLMRCLIWCSASENFIIIAKGMNNDIADALSHFQANRFRQLAPGAALKPCQCPFPRM